MNNRSANQNDPNTNVELRIRTMRTLWIALLLSIGSYCIVTIFLKPSANVTPNPMLSLILLAGAMFTTLVSFPIKNRLLSRAVDQQQAQLVQQAYIVGWAINEVGALLGMLDYFATGHRHYYIPFLIAAGGLLLHFPRREPVVNATFKTLTCVLLFVVASPIALSQQQPQTKSEPAHKLVVS